MSSPKSGSAFKINTGVSFAGTFLDVPGKSHTAQWVFDSSTAAPGTVTEPTVTKVGTVKGTYAFPAAGVYGVQMKVIDPQGLTGTSDSVDGIDALVIAYDPNGGYVMGGGWLDSPPGSLTSNPSAAGKVAFGFVSKY
ncbi:MAG: hypothetical protein L0170_07585, partial [Acidobacteria bacterium]|nr:hypothetical protein [Acidobacteriota bacterium]